MSNLLKSMSKTSLYITNISLYNNLNIQANYMTSHKYSIQLWGFEK